MQQKRDRSTLGQALKGHRQAAGYTQKELADVLGIEYYTMVSQMELGYMPIPPALWLPIADALGIDRTEWALLCLSEIQPEVYQALFEGASLRQARVALKSLTTGTKKEEACK